jgi:opacity protein-like surface antigen
LQAVSSTTAAVTFPEGEDKMKKLLMLATLAAVAAVAARAARPGASAPPGDPRLALLQKQVKILQAQVKAQQGQVKVLQGRVRSLTTQVGVNFEGDTCLAAQTADLFQGTWGVIDQVAQAAQQTTYFGPQTQVSDYGNCAELSGPDVPRPGIVVPPTIAPLLPLLQWLHE